MSHDDQARIKQIIEDWDYDCGPVEDLLVALDTAGYVIVPKNQVSRLTADGQ